MRHLIDPMDLSVEDIDRLLDRADDIAKNPEKYQEVCKHKKLATLFFEPSTRTRLSFEAAMLELGGSVLGFSSADSSSASKGESVADTARVIEMLCRYHCDASSKGRSAICSITVCKYPCDQCRRRWS